MFANFTKFAFAVAIFVSATSTATAQYRNELVPITPSIPAMGGIDADVSALDTSSGTVVGFVARVDSFHFGSGTIANMPHGSTAPLSYTWSSFTFQVTPGAFGWQGWSYGWGDVLFTDI